MRIWPWIVGLLLAAGACSNSGTQDPMAGTSDDHFTCAALISAADRLLGAGKLPADAFPADQTLPASMGHLNAWAVPKGLTEKQAFDAVNAEREKLLSQLTPEEIGKRAAACIARANDPA